MVDKLIARTRGCRAATGWLCALGFSLVAGSCASSGDDDDASGSSGSGAGGSAGSSAPVAGSTPLPPAAGGGGGGIGVGVSGTSGGAGMLGAGAGAGAGGTQSSAGRGGSGAGGGGGANAGVDGGTDAGSEDPVVPRDQGLVGWASESGDGVTTTTGGDGGRTVTASDADQLIEYAESEEPLIIQLDGSFAIPELRVASNKTLIGGEGGATIEGGVRIRGSGGDEMVSNVIVKNIRIHGATSDTDGDGMHIYYAHHVWIDHCEIWDSPDGNLDIVHASSWVTVSWTKFWYSDDAPAADHRFSNLIGHSDPNDEDEGRLKVTFHHDWWGPGVIERMPRVRYGDVHVFNNYYSAVGNNYAVGAGYEARLLIENNHFDGVTDPHIFYDGEPTAEIAIAGNAYDGASTSSMQQMGQGASFMAPYDYELDPAASVKSLVTQGAGPQ